MTSVTRFALASPGTRRSDGGTTGSRAFSVQTTRPTSATTPTTRNGSTSSSPFSRTSTSAYVIPTRPTATRPEPTRSSVERPCVSRSSPRPASASTTVRAASGTLIRKTQRHEIVCTMTPPSGGPPTVARLVRDVQRPIARPASPAQVTRSSARLVVVEHGAADSLQRPAADQHALARRERREQRCQGEEDDADDERATEADAVADRAADEVEGRERERVREVDPLLTAEAEPEVLLHPRQRHDHNRRVEERERRAERRREQRQQLHAARRLHPGTLSARL